LIQSRKNQLLRGLEMLLRFYSINHRMHNKAWIADGRVAVVGGRNIADEYFDANASHNFFDIDLLVGGVAVSEAEQIFDRFWNSELVIPIEELMISQPHALANLRIKMDNKQFTSEVEPYRTKLQQTASIRRLLEGRWPTF